MMMMMKMMMMLMIMIMMVSTDDDDDDDDDNDDDNEVCGCNGDYNQWQTLRQILQGQANCFGMMMSHISFVLE